MARLLLSESKSALDHEEEVIPPLAAIQNIVEEIGEDYIDVDFDGQVPGALLRIMDENKILYGLHADVKVFNLKGDLKQQVYEDAYHHGIDEEEIPRRVEYTRIILTLDRNAELWLKLRLPRQLKRAVSKKEWLATVATEARTDWPLHIHLSHQSYGFVEE